MGSLDKIYGDKPKEDNVEYGIQTKIIIPSTEAESGFKETYKAVAFWAGGSTNTNEDNITEETTNDETLNN